MRTHTTQPILMTARFTGRCSETHRAIVRGDLILFLPVSKKTFCYDSKAAQALRERQLHRLDPRD